MDLVSPIIDIVSRFCDCTASRVSYIHELEENLDNLRTLMDELKDIRNDVRSRVELEEGKQMKRTNQVEGWLRRVDAMETEVDEILREGSKDIEERCLGGCCPENCRSSYKLGKRVARKLTTLEKLRSKGSFNVVAERLPLAPVQVMPGGPTVGMDLMFEKVWNCIREEQVGILGIYGMGGVGKTTLLKRINNEFLHRGTCDFDVVIWVVVSKEVSLMRIQKDIENRLGLALPEDGSLDDRAAKLCSMLVKKRFMLLLDDIWDRVDLEAIGIPYPNINNKSKVMFTTRSEAICGRMDVDRKIRVECLGCAEAMKLFQQKVGEEAPNSHPEIAALAVDVAKECAGLPLALITIGRAMAGKKTLEEWKYAITILKKSASEFSGMGDEVFPILKFSYDSLCDDTIRSCFLYCSLFPEDYSIMIEELIYYWIGEGFLDGFDDMNEARNKGYDIIGRLKLACLLESGVGSTKEVKMHDVIRDLALWLSLECGKKKDKVLVRAGVHLSEAPEVGKWVEAEKISLMINDIKSPGDGIPACPNLSTLIICKNRHLTSFPIGFFQYMHVLRVLDLSRTEIHEFPMGIVDLRELQYLNLSDTFLKKLPREMKNLVKLKYLDLSLTYDLQIIPCETISRFSKLKVLNLSHSYFGHWEVGSYVGLDNSGDGVSIEELECLKDLNELSIIIKSALSLARFLNSDNFKRCTIMLSIMGCQGLTSFPLSTTEILKSLKELECTSCFDLEEIAISWSVGKEGNCLPTSLEKLHLKNLPRLKLIKNGCFPNLRDLKISNCDVLKYLSLLHVALTLESLFVAECKCLEMICGERDAEENKNRTAFSCLKSLSLINLPELKTIHGFSFRSVMLPTVHNCPKILLRC